MDGQLLRQSELMNRGGSYPSRVVLRYIEEKNEFVTHIKAIPKKENPFYVHGNYFQSAKAANENFAKRLDENGTTEVPISNNQQILVNQIGDDLFQNKQLNINGTRAEMNQYAIDNNFDGGVVVSIALAYGFETKPINDIHIKGKDDKNAKK